MNQTQQGFGNNNNKGLNKNNFALQSTKTSQNFFNPGQYTSMTSEFLPLPTRPHMPDLPMHTAKLFNPISRQQLTNNQRSVANHTTNLTKPSQYTLNDPLL